jgi:steroid 5-alpha reductase family enzyme
VGVDSVVDLLWSVGLRLVAKAALFQSQRKAAAVLRFVPNYQPLFTARYGCHIALCYKSNSGIAAANLSRRPSLPSLALASHNRTSY